MEVKETKGHLGKKLRKKKPAPRAGAIVMRKQHGETQILIARSIKNPGCWIFPKGHIDPGETAAQAAVREVREETGVVVRIVSSLGCAEYSVSGGPILIDFFLAEAVGEAERVEDREIRWCSVEEAERLLSFRETRDLLVRTVPLIEGEAG